jgi:hypothetical protein
LIIRFPMRLKSSRIPPRRKTNFTSHFNDEAHFKPFRENKSFLKIRKSGLSCARSGPDEGRTRRHERWTGNAMDAVLSGAFQHADEWQRGGRRSRVVLALQRRR